MTGVLVVCYVAMAVILAVTGMYRRFLLRPSPIDPTYRPKAALLLVVSHQDYTWATYWEFLVRQLAITRVYSPTIWRQGVVMYLLTGAVLAYGSPAA